MILFVYPSLLCVFGICLLVCRPPRPVWGFGDTCVCHVYVRVRLRLQELERVCSLQYRFLSGKGGVPGVFNDCLAHSFFDLVVGILQHGLKGSICTFVLILLDIWMSLFCSSILFLFRA